MDNDPLLAFQAALNNLCVIVAVATAAAGPVIGLWGLRFHSLLTRVGERHMAVGALLSCFGLPMIMLAQLIGNPDLALADHREQAMWGLLFGLLMLIGGGIGYVIESRSAGRQKQ